MYIYLFYFHPVISHLLKLFISIALFLYQFVSDKKSLANKNDIFYKKDCVLISNKKNKRSVSWQNSPKCKETEGNRVREGGCDGVIERTQNYF